MKLLSPSLGGIGICLVVSAACSPQSQPLPAPIIPSAISPTMTSAGVATPSLQPVDFGDAQAGTVMQWMDGSQLVFVPAGEFVMGADGPDDPQHRVSLSDYWIHRTEVTNRQYGLCVKVGQCGPPADPQAATDLADPGLLENPVVGVDWQQAQTYCTWIKGSLPTEAQWEKAARGPEGNKFPWGAAGPTDQLLNFNSDVGATSNVANYPLGKSYYAALDMAGNVFEWALDYYQSDYYASSPPADPPGPASGDVRSVRGSGFSSNADQIPVATRFHSPPDQYRQDLGFRCVVKDPGRFAPYCQTTGFLTGGSTPNGCSPTVSTAYECDRASHPHVGRGSAIFSGGIASSVTVLSPTDGSVTCGVGRAGAIYCAGPAGGATAQVQVEVSCGGSAPGSPTGGLTDAPSLDVACPPGAIHPADNPDACVPDPSLGVHEVADACPRGFDLVDGHCLSSPPSLSGDPGDSTGDMPCPPGSYRLTDHCEAIPTPLLPGSECLSGFTFDAANGCCHAPDPGSYPGCGAGEALRLVPSGPDDLSPLTSCSPADRSTSSLTVSITTGACEKNDSGAPSCSSITSDSVCNSTPGCSFNYQTKSCN